MPNLPQRESDRSVEPSPPPGGLDRSLPAARRLRRSALFTETFAQGRKWVGRRMVLWLRAGEGAALRLGVVAGKKAHRRAVERNRARRRLRELYRRLRPFLRGDRDVVLVARRGVTDAPWGELVEEILHLTRRAGLLDADRVEQARRELLGKR